jgi:hypothetical protein
VFVQYGKGRVGLILSKAAGKWTMDFAKEIGKDVVVEAIKVAMGIL